MNSWDFLSFLIVEHSELVIAKTLEEEAGYIIVCLSKDCMVVKWHALRVDQKYETANPEWMDPRQTKNVLILFSVEYSRVRVNVVWGTLI
jgi:hypothetical protein